MKIFEESENVVKRWYFPKILYLTVTVQYDKLLQSDYLNGIFSGKNVLVRMAENAIFSKISDFSEKIWSVLYLTVMFHDGKIYHEAPLAAFSEKPLTSAKNNLKMLNFFKFSDFFGKFSIFFGNNFGTILINHRRG